MHVLVLAEVYRVYEYIYIYIFVKSMTVSLLREGERGSRCVQEGRVPAPTQGKCEGQGRARP